MKDGIIINTGGGPVINGGTFENVEFVAHKYVVNEPIRKPCEDVVDVETVETQDAGVQKSTMGRNIEHLFQNKNNEKDDAKSKKNAAKFNAYLQKNNLSGIKINTSKKNKINIAFVDFYVKWLEEQQVVDQPNGMACYRFLSEDCGLNIGVDNPKTYAEFIIKLIKEKID